MTTLTIPTTHPTYTALNAAWEAWHATYEPDPQTGRNLYQRIAAGKAYMAAHPGDAGRAKLLAELEAKARAVEPAYWVANVAYKEMCDEATK